MAIFFPRLAAIPVAHFRSASVRGLRRRRIETATCTSSLRIRLLPALVMCPLHCFSPELHSLGVSPKYASTWCALLKRCASSTVEEKAAAVTRPTLGAVRGGV
jgi:hypothetical protein